MMPIGLGIKKAGIKTKEWSILKRIESQKSNQNIMPVIQFLKTVF